MVVTSPFESVARYTAKPSDACELEEVTVPRSIVVFDVDVALPLSKMTADVVRLSEGAAVVDARPADAEMPEEARLEDDVMADEVELSVEEAVLLGNEPVEPVSVLVVDVADEPVPETDDAEDVALAV